MIDYVKELRDIRFSFRPEEIIDYETLVTLIGSLLVSEDYENNKEELFHTIQILVLVYGLEDQLEGNGYAFDINNIDLNDINLWKYLLVALYNDLVKTNDFTISEELKDIYFTVLNRLNDKYPEIDTNNEHELENNNDFNDFFEHNKQLKENSPIEQNSSYFSLNSEDEDLENFNWDYLKEYIIKNNLIPYKCDCCGMNEWQGKYLSLKLVHKDPNCKKQSLNNLKFLCPNCYSQIGKE